MKVLLLNPPFTDYGGLEGHGGKSLPLNLAYLAAYLREKKPKTEIRVLDCEGLRLTYDRIEEEIRAIKPDLVGITCPTPAFVQVLEICRIIKSISPNIITVVGGPHPTAMPKETVSEKNIDVAVLYEGEHTFTDLAETIEKNESLERVKGIFFKDSKDGIYENPPREIIKDLDSLPFPARDLFPLDIYFPPPTKRMSNKKTGNMITSRGCPYRCTYCMASYMWQRRVRFRSIKNVMDEIEECINKYGIAEFNFHDELFTVNKQRVIEFCREVKRRNLDIVWVCMIRVDFVDEETLKEMESAGCKKIAFGFESGSQMILDQMKKRVALEKAEEAVKLVKKAGIKTAGSFMLGNIGETEETIRQTINLAKRLNCDTMAFFIASPYPGTEFYETAKANGYFRRDLEWKDFALVSNNLPPLNLPGLPAERILYWQKKAYREYYLRPKYILSKIAGINSLVDLKNLYNGVKLFLRLKG
ncbi:MAG: Radical SAM domain protein [Parcubacteria group bacterium GW2011_GWB1_41_6]|nr:MAG: Radical SAM domain protein [Parcubacteria group bacterium GW2011_GWB1_41_6]